MTATVSELRNGQMASDALPTAAVPETFSLGALVNELREDGCAESEMAARVLEAADADLIRPLIVRLLQHEIEAAYLNRPRRRAKQLFSGEGGLDRWRAASARGRVSADLHGFWITPLSKEFGDCTPAEVLGYADELDAYAVEVADTAKCYRAAGELGKRRRAKLMRDVPAEKLAEVFYA